MTAPERITVVVLAFGDEPILHEAVQAVLGSEGVDVDVVLVDNGCTSDAVRSLPEDERLRIVTPAENLGFAGGVNHGARDVTTEYLALVNSDAVVRPDTLARLVAVASQDDVGIASGSIRLASDPDSMNSAGNPVHVVGLSWAGGLGEPASEHSDRRDVASASGACLVLRTSLWQELDGFADEYFAYHEDVDLSWRTWMSGRRVVYVPDAVAVHHYEFSRNALKMFLLEKNRLIFVRTTYGDRLLAAVRLPMAVLDVVLRRVAHSQGWGEEKRRADGWVRDNAAWIADRRRQVQSRRRAPDRDLVHLLTAQVDQQVFSTPRGTSALQLVMRAYWAVVRRFV